MYDILKWYTDIHYYIDSENEFTYEIVSLRNW